MTSPQSSSAEAAQGMAERMAQQGYGVGMPALQNQLSMINQGIAQGGQPGYVADAYNLQRTGLIEGAGQQQVAGMGQMARGNEAAVAGGGGLANILNPGAYGAQLAQLMMGSNLQQGLGALDETNKLMTMGLGGGAEAGSAMMGAAGSNLQAIGGMANYNPQFANLMGALNLGGSMYGAGAFGGGGGGGGGQGQISLAGGTWT
jgi:hypothetical protein